MSPRPPALWPVAAFRAPAIAFSGTLFVAILRRGFAQTLDDTRVGDTRDGLLDPLHLNLMKPIVTEIEPVAEHTIGTQAKIVKLCRACVSNPLFLWSRTRESVIGPVGIE